jgi:uncharacterized protein YkwD
VSKSSGSSFLYSFPCRHACFLVLAILTHLDCAVRRCLAQSASAGAAAPVEPPRTVSADPPVSARAKDAPVTRDVLARPSLPRGVRAAPVAPVPLLDPRLIREMHALHNDVRVSNRRQLIELSDELSRIAQAYAELLHDHGRSAHDLDGWVTNRLTRAGYKYVRCGENLATAGPLVDHEAVFRKWMNSPRHLANVLGPFREMGVGHYGTMWVIVFAMPQR